MVFFILVFRFVFLFSVGGLEPSIFVKLQLLSPIIIKLISIKRLLMIRFRLFVLGLAFVTAVNFGVIKPAFVDLFVIDLLDFLRNRVPVDLVVLADVIVYYSLVLISKVPLQDQVVYGREFIVLVVLY